MSDLERDALRVSAVLDDGEGTLDPQFAGQGRVHAGLSARGAAPSERPDVDIRARVMMRIGEPAGGSRRGWPVAVAASLTLMAGIGWVVVKSMQPAAFAPQPPRVADVRGTGASIAGILRPINRADSQISVSLDATFEQQVKLIQQDTQQGMEMVLSRLPLGAPAQGGTVK
jgi:hypothetical protein